MEAGKYDNGYEYIKIGKNTSKRKILVIPGLNDEMMRSTRYPLYLRYHFRDIPERQIIIASRKEGLKKDITTKEMAEHYKQIIDQEGRCNVLTVSMGGMIAQHLAKRTEKIEKLVLGLTGTRLGEEGRKDIKSWIELLQQNEERKFFSRVVKDTFEGPKKHFYRTGSSVLWRKFSRPPTEDLIACAKACLDHDTTSDTLDIDTDTMVIGAHNDSFFPKEVISQASQKIGAETRYISGGHAAFHQNSSEFHDEARRFFDR